MDSKGHVVDVLGGKCWETRGVRTESDLSCRGCPGYRESVMLDSGQGWKDSGLGKGRCCAEAEAGPRALRCLCDQHSIFTSSQLNTD